MTQTREHKGTALIVQHCAVFGRLPKTVRWFKVGDVRPYAQFERTVSVLFLEPKKRRQASFTIKPENLRYLTVEIDGQVVYDSRHDVPCDMDQWAKTAAAYSDSPPITVVRHPAGGAS